jgi:hypothetical protein
LTYVFNAPDKFTVHFRTLMMCELERLVSKG